MNDKKATKTQSMVEGTGQKTGPSFSDKEILTKVEAILFSCGRRISYDEISKIINKSPAEIKKAVLALKHQYSERNTSLVVIDYENSAKLTVKEQHLGTVRKINPETEMSKSLIETLAVIAWKNPCLQSDVVKIRTNKAYNDISELEQLGFITKEKKGRSFLLRLTAKFYSYFDLKTDKDITNLFNKFAVKYNFLDKEPKNKKKTQVYEPK